MTGPRARVTGQLTQMTGLRARVTGQLTQMTGLRARMTGPRARMTGQLVRVTGMLTWMTGQRARTTSVLAGLPICLPVWYRLFVGSARGILGMAALTVRRDANAASGGGGGRIWRTKWVIFSLASLAQPLMSGLL